MHHCCRCCYRQYFRATGSLRTATTTTRIRAATTSIFAKQTKFELYYSRIRNMATATTTSSAGGDPAAGTAGEGSAPAPATTPAAPLKKRSVVSNFIIKYPEEGQEEGGKPMVALFRRSDKVSTYTHHLAPISGSIEKDDPSPLAAAWRELHEETTLTDKSLELIRQGKSYSFSDPSVGRTWTIYPFAYRLKSPREGGKGEKGIQIDWEHEGWGWYDPLEVEDSEQFGGVPRLAESLRRVWFEKDLGADAGAVLAQGLDRLKHDQQSGARQLAGVALGILKDVIRALNTHDPTDVWWAKVRFAAWHIWKNGRESMGAAIMSVLLEALRSIEDTIREHEEHPGSIHSIKWRDSVVADLERRISLRGTTSADQVSGAFGRYLREAFAAKLEAGAPLSVLTLSESSTISHCLRQAFLKSAVSLDLRVLESRPLFEGVSLAGSLAGDFVTEAAPAEAKAEDDGGGEGGGESAPAPPPPPRAKITIYTDASAALAAEGVDIILLGADRIASSGAVSNKTGSLPAVLSAKQVSPGAKTMVLGESEKVAPPGDPREHVVEDNDPNQLIRAWKSDFNSERVRNAAGSLERVIGAAEEGSSEDGAGARVKVNVRNVFFEWVPPELVDVYVTEFGVWSLEDIKKHSEWLGAEEERLFRDV